jgi:hypothetical protein
MKTPVTTSEKRPGIYARAEAGSRRAVLLLGLGVLAYFIGSVGVAGLSNRLADRLDPVESEWLAWAFSWLMQRLWLFVVLPLFAYATGRFTSIPPSRFAWVASLAGEGFSLLVVTAIDGVEVLIVDPREPVARVGTFLVGVLLVYRAGVLGRADAAADEERAKVEAEQRKAEYAEFLARAEGGPPKEPPAASPPA